MAHFVRVRSPGFWTSGSTLLPAELESFDAQLFKAVNGDQGGVWAPSAIIEIGGLGIKITGACVVTSQAQLQGGAAVTGGNLTVSLAATIQGALAAQGGLAVSGGNLTCALDADVQGEFTAGQAGIGGAVEAGFALKVTGATKISGGNLACSLNADVQGELTAGSVGFGGAVEAGFVLKVTGAAKVTGTLAVTGAASLAGNLSVNGTTEAKGRFKRRVLTMGNADTTVGVGDYDLVFMPTGVLSADRTLTLSDVLATEGDVLRVKTQDATYFVNVYGNGGSSLASLKLVATSLDWVEFTYINGDWQITARGDRNA